MKTKKSTPKVILSDVTFEYRIDGDLVETYQASDITDAYPIWFADYTEHKWIHTADLPKEVQKAFSKLRKTLKIQ